jgi:Omp85 superfamily domain
MMKGFRWCKTGGPGRFSPLLLVLLLLASPGLGRAEEDPAAQNAVPSTGGDPATMKTGLELPESRESEPKVKEPQLQKRLLTIPFPFYNATIGPGIGLGVIGKGYVQPQAEFVMAALVGAGNYSVYFKALHYQFPWFRRFILEPDFYVAKYSDVDTYTGTDNPGYAGERAGSNDSDKNNYIKSDANDHWVNLFTKFLLPIGHGRDRILPKLVLDRGVFVSGDTGGDVWNPLESGRTYIEVIPFERRQSLIDNNSHSKTAGIEIGLRYDNTDFRFNPSKGSMQRVWFVRDWGALNSTAPYSVVGGEFAKYFPLGPSDRARERVIAFDIWTINCLTWDDSSTINGTETFHRPPAYKGASLGGLSRLRAYPATRFNDQAGILYTLEYRYLLNWNPLKNVTWGGKLQVDWFELVGFGELGRVAPSWNLSTLHENMKYDAGVGIRAMVNNVVVRIDVAAGPEGFATQMFVGHPFPFY